MKQKFVLSLVVFVCAFVVTTRAQISKGAVWVGGSIGYNQTKSGVDTPYDKSNNFNINPSAGIAVKDNLIVGISLLYGHSKRESPKSNIVEDKSNSYGIGLFVRQYIPVISRLYVFADAGVNYQTSKGDYKILVGYPNVINKSTTRGWSSSMNLTPGVAFAVTKKFHIETSLASLFGVTYKKDEIKTVAQGGNPIKPEILKNDSFTAGIFTDGKAQFNIGCRFLL